MIQRILNTQTKSINLAAFILGSASLISAVLGLFRDLLLARQFGAGDDLDIYYAAFRIPDFIALILIMGAVSAAVIPVFSQYWSRSKEEAWDFLSIFLNVALTVLIAVSAVLVIFAPFLISLVAPGFTGEKRELTILLTRIMFLSPIILGVSNVISGILQVFQRFLITSLAPILYNVGIILGILFFAPKMGVIGLAWGVVLGACLHFIIQLPVFFISGFRYKAVFNFLHKGVIEVIKLTAPRSFGLAASQINLIVITAIASTLAAGSIAIFTLANNVVAILLTIIALPFANAVFPALSLMFFDQDKSNFFRQFSVTFRHIIFLIIPASFLFFALKTQIITLLFGSAKFGVNDIQLTAVCLGLFSIGIFAQGLILLLSKTFFAAHNTKFPAVTSAIAVVINIALSFLFVSLMRFPTVFQRTILKSFSLNDSAGVEVVGLPLALSISAVFQFFLLFILFRRHVGAFDVKAIISSFWKILLASIIMVVFVYFAVSNIPFYLNLNLATFMGVFWQTIIAVFVGLLAYISSTFLFRLPELKTIIK